MFGGQCAFKISMVNSYMPAGCAGGLSDGNDVDLHHRRVLDVHSTGGRCGAGHVHFASQPPGCEMTGPPIESRSRNSAGREQNRTLRVQRKNTNLCVIYEKLKFFR